MTRDDIIRMAREADWHVSGSRVLSPVVEGTDLLWLLEHFAAIVAAEAIKYGPDYKVGYADGVAAEREACAKVADDAADNVGPIELDIGGSIATAIRARGQQ